MVAQSVSPVRAGAIHDPRAARVAPVVHVAGVTGTTVSASALRWTGTAGMLGALALFAGDALNCFNAANPAPGGNYLAAQAATLAQVAPWRLVAAGALGPVAGWLGLIGAWQMYLALRGTGARLAAATAGAFAAILVWAATFHVAIVPRALGEQVAHQLGGNGAAAQFATQLPQDFFGALLLVLAVPLLVFTALFVYAVLWRRSAYPRWIVVLTPTFLFVATHVPEYMAAPASGPFYGAYSVLVGGAASLGLLAFFAASTAALWHGGAQHGHES